MRARSACALLNEVFDAFSASCSEASGASAGAEMDAANFSISENLWMCDRDREREETEGGQKERIKQGAEKRSMRF